MGSTSKATDLLTHPANVIICPDRARALRGGGQPTGQPTEQALGQPTDQPTEQALGQPTEQALGQPTNRASARSTNQENTMDIWRELKMEPPFKNGPMNIFQLTGVEIAVVVDKLSLRGFKLTDRTIHRWVSPAATTTPRLPQALAFSDIVHQLRPNIPKYKILKAIVDAKRKFYYPKER